MGATCLDLRISRHEPASTVIEASGEIDLSSCSRLRDELLLALERGMTVLDTTAVSFCDSSGIRALVEAQHAARAGDTSLRLAGMSPAVGRVLDFAGVTTVFDIFPDVQTALKD